MENSVEYDRITQTLEIPSEVVNQVMNGESAEKFKQYICTELAHKLAEKLLKSGYISITSIIKDHYTECTATLYVKPLIKNN